MRACRLVTLIVAALSITSACPTHADLHAVTHSGIVLSSTDDGVTSSITTTVSESEVVALRPGLTPGIPFLPAEVATSLPPSMLARHGFC